MSIPEAKLNCTLCSQEHSLSKEESISYTLQLYYSSQTDRKHLICILNENEKIFTAKGLDYDLKYKPNIYEKVIYLYIEHKLTTFKPLLCVLFY